MLVVCVWAQDMSIVTYWVYDSHPNSFLVLQVSSGLESPGRVLGRLWGRRITPFAVKVLGQGLGPHDPSCNSLILYWVLHWVYVLSTLCINMCWVSSLRPSYTLSWFACVLNCIYRSPKGAGLVPGLMKFSRGHAEFSAESEAYGDGFACLLPVASR